MKAVIMAGGEGTRLRPLTCHMPKPMARLLDRPVMEYIVRLLARRGVEDIAATLQYMPHLIEDYFGDGAPWGVRMHYYRENTPLGTAGSVRQCSQMLDGDFIVISGDALCDFDLTEAADFHREHDADVTVVLCRHKRPLDYGLVLTGEDGRIERFIEKPSWGQVFADTVNTGIYVISPRVLSRIPPDRAYDFARDLFPNLLGDGGRLFGCVLEGYWCDIGDCEAFLSCAQDILAGRVDVEIPAPERERGIWSVSPLPAGPKITPPCYIGRDAVLEGGAVIGPGAVIGAGSFVGRGASVKSSILDGAHIADGAVLQGALLCRGASAGAQSSIGEGAVIGERTTIGAHAIVHDGVRIWPEKMIPEGARIRFHIQSGARSRLPVIGEDGVMQGEANIDLPPEVLTTIGSAAGMLAGAGARIGLSCDGSEAAQAALRALEAGVRAAGTHVVASDAAYAAASGFAAGLSRLSIALFVGKVGKMLRIHLLSGDGLPLSRPERKKLEGFLARGDVQRADAGSIGKTAPLYGVQSVYSAAAAAQGGAPELACSVPCDTPSGRALAAALSMMGADVNEHSGYMPSFFPSPDGLSLDAEDEEGRPLDDAHTMAVAALCAMREGQDIGVAYGAPAALDALAAAGRRRVLRTERDGDEARALWSSQRFMHDAIFRAAFIAAYMSRSGESLASLHDALPEFFQESREVAVGSDRGQVMRALADACEHHPVELHEGMRVCMDGGWVHVRPLTEREAIRITVEGANAEIAEELCDLFESRARKLDRKSAPEQKSDRK